MCAGLYGHPVNFRLIFRVKLIAALVIDKISSRNLPFTVRNHSTSDFVKN